MATDSEVKKGLADLPVWLLNDGRRETDTEFLEKLHATGVALGFWKESEGRSAELTKLIAAMNAGKKAGIGVDNSLKVMAARTRGHNSPGEAKAALEDVMDMLNANGGLLAPEAEDRRTTPDKEVGEILTGAKALGHEKEWAAADTSRAAAKAERATEKAGADAAPAGEGLSFYKLVNADGGDDTGLIQAFDKALKKRGINDGITTPSGKFLKTEISYQFLVAAKGIDTDRLTPKEAKEKLRELGQKMVPDDAFATTGNDVIGSATEANFVNREALAREASTNVNTLLNMTKI